MGLILGWQKTIFGITAAAYIGLLIIILLALAGKFKLKMKLPFGPILIASTYFSLLFGQHFIDWYIRLAISGV